MQQYPGMQGAPVMVGAPDAQLGQQIAQYKGALVYPIIGSIFMLLLGALMTLLGISTNDGVAITITGVIILLAGLVYFYFLVIRSLGKLVTVYQNGLTVKQSGVTSVIPWDDISALTLDQRRVNYRIFLVIVIPLYTIHIFSLTRRNGQRVRIRGYQNMAELGSQLEPAVTSRVYPQMVAAYRAGQPIPFGPFTISQMGITKGAETAPWNTITSVGTSVGYYGVSNFSVRRQGKTLNWTAQIHRLPNLGATMTLINAIRSGQV